jgi:hypothetical protein
MKLRQYPQQSARIGQRVEVLFNDGTRFPLPGVLVRQDVEEPFVTILQLTNGQYVLATECPWSPVPGTVETQAP